jgi:hypothetical protein
LEQARITRSPARFWYRPTGGRFSFLAWVAVLGRAWVAGVGQDGRPRPELEWAWRPSPGQRLTSGQARSSRHWRTRPRPPLLTRLLRRPRPLPPTPTPP